MSTQVTKFTTPTTTRPTGQKWTAPANMINGWVQATVYGSPGQGPGNDATPGDGLGAKIIGYIPCNVGDIFDIYVADGGSNGWGGTNAGLNAGGAGGTGQGTGFHGGHGGASSAVVRETDGATMIEAAGGGGMGGYQDATKAPYVAGNGGSAGQGTGVQGSDGSPGGSIGIGGTPIGAGTAASTSGAGTGGVAPAGSTGPGQAGAPTGSGAGGNAGATGDSTNCGGGGGGGGGFYGGGGGAGGMSQGGGGGGGAGLSYVDPTVFGLDFAGYSYLFGSVVMICHVADAPLSPNWLSPANNGYADMAVQPQIAFQYVPDNDSGTLNSWALQRVIGATTQYWNAQAQAWSASIVWNDVSFLTQGLANIWLYTFPNGAFSNGSAIQLSVATTESYYGLGTASPAWSTAVTINASAEPTVTVTAPAYQSDQNTVTPTISWNETLSATPQTKLRVKLFNKSQYSAAGFDPNSSAPWYDSGSVSSAATSWAIPGPGLPSDTTYRAFVQVADNHGETNLWGSSGSWTEFNVRLTNYTAPGFTAAAGTDPNNGAPCAVLTITPSGTPVATSVSAEYSDDGGTTWLPVLEAWKVSYSGSGSVTAYDRSIPYGKARQYRATVDGTEVINSVTWPSHSPWSATQTVTVTNPKQWWLSIAGAGGGSSPTAGSLGLHRVTTGGSASSSDVPLDTSIEINELEQQGTFRPFGRSVPVTVRGDLYAEEFDLGFVCLTDAEYQDFVWMRRQRKTMVLRSDMGDVYYGIIGPDRPAALLRAADRVSTPNRVVVVHWIPADIPTVT